MPLRPIEQALLRALRGSPESTLDELAAAVGLPRTNFGRQMTTPIETLLERLVDEGLVARVSGHYHLTDQGREALVAAALERRSPPGGS